MSTAGSLLRGSILRTLELGAMLAATFFVTPYLVHSLGDRMYGFWTLVGSIVGYYGILDLGLTAAAARFMSQALGKDSEAELDSVANTALFLFAAGAAAAVAVTIGAAAACPRFVRDPEEAALMQQLIIVMGAAAAIGFPSKVFSGLLQAGIRYDAIAGISIARIVLYNTAIYVCLTRHHGVLAVAVITSVVSVLQYGAIYWTARRRYPKLRISPWRFDRSKIRSMLDYGYKIVFCQVGDMLRFRVDSLVIAGFLGASLVTPYNVATRLAEGLSQLVRSSVGMMFPVFSQYEGRGDYDAIRSALLRSTKLSSLLTGFVGFSVLFYGHAFIRRWMGPGYDNAYWLAVILCAAEIIDLPQSPGIQLLYGLSKHQIYAVLNIWEGIANVVLSILFLRWWGVYGVALGTLAEMAFFKLFIQPIYICRAAGLPLRAYLGDAVLLTLAKTAVPLALYFFLIGRLVTPNYWALAAAVAAQTVLFAPGAYYFILGEPERDVIERALRGLFDKRPYSSSILSTQASQR